MRRIDIMAGFTAEDVQAVAGMLSGGCVGIVPTDTVYGIAAVATDAGAVERLAALKERPPDQPFPVHAASLREAETLALFGDAARRLAARFWPGALTMVLARRSGAATVPPSQPEESIGLRVPDSDFCASLIEHAGCLVLPSANLRGGAPPACVADIEEELLGRVDFLVDAGRCELGVESSVVDLTGPGVRVLREGAIAAAEIMAVAQGNGPDA